MRHETTRGNLRVYKVFRGSHLPEISFQVGKKVRAVRRPAPGGRREPVAALVAAQVSASAGSRERDGGDLVLGEARWRKENGFQGPLVNLGPRRYSSAFLDGCRWVKQAPRARSSSCPASRLLESRRVGDGIARWPTGLVLLLVRPGLKRKKHP